MRTRGSWVPVLAVVGASIMACGGLVDSSEDSLAGQSSPDNPSTTQAAWVSSGGTRVSYLGGPTCLRTSKNSTIVNSVPGTVTPPTTVVAFDCDTAQVVNRYTSTTESYCPGDSRVAYAQASGTPAMGQSFNGPSSVPANANGSWPVLFGAPSLGQEPGTSYAYMTTLAIPSVNMPKGGGCTTGDASNLVGGACILRSTDGGKTFAPQTDSDCLNNAGRYDVWDGGEIVGTTTGYTLSPNGPVYAAFHNKTLNQIDFFMASSPTAAFVQQATPFPGSTIRELPRMLDDTGGGVYVIAGGYATRGAGIYWQHFNQGSWSIGNGLPIADVTNGHYSAHGVIGGVTIAQRTQYDLTWVRFPGQSAYLYIAYTTGGVSILPESINVAICNDGSGGASCIPGGGGPYDIPGVSGSNMFNPSIANTVVWNNGYGNGPYLSAVKLTWLQGAAASGGQVDVYSADLGDGTNDGSGVLHIRREAGSTGVCPTAVPPHWDDYDTHLGIYQSSFSANPIFVRAFPDSTDGPCSTRWTYYSSPVFTSTTYVAWP